MRPHLEYGVPVWAHAAKSDLDKLDKIQYAAGRIKTEATRSTSTDYVEHEAELIPLNKRNDDIMLKYGSRLKRLREGHMNHDLITKCHKIYRLKRSSPLELYSDLVTRYELNEVLQDLIISQRSPHKYEPWVTTGIPDIQLTQKEPCSQSEDPWKLKRVAEDVINSVPDNCIKIFTDGLSDNSYLNGGSAAVIIQMSTGAESTLSLTSGKLSSNFASEVFAILSSLKEVLQMNNLHHI